MARCVNRAALVVRPRQPYLDWVASLDDEAPADSQDSAKGVSVYLVREDPKGEEETAPLKNYYANIFESELAAWSTDERQWPKARSLRVFQEWFETVGESIVTDLESSPIEIEEL